jgi:hypothetical protein
MLNSVSIIESALQTVQHVIKAEKALRVVTDRFKPGAVKGLGEVDCRELELKLEVDVAKIVRWQNLWFEETGTSEDFFQTLWGQSGRNRIQRLLQSILSECDTIQDAIAGLAAMADGLVQKHNVRRADWWRKLSNLHRLSLKTQIENAEDKQIRDKVDTLSDYIDELWTSSELCFRSLHGVPRGNEELASVGDTTTLISHALESRNASTALYWHCQSRSIDLDLEMNLLNHDREVDKFPDLFDWSDLKLSYHVLCKLSSSPSSAREVVLEPCLASEHIQEEKPDEKDDEEASLDLALIRTRSEFTVRLPACKEAPEVYFHVTSKASASWQDVEPEVLSLFADRIPKTQPRGVNGRFSLTEKISLAYRIVECGLFLLGTPWLSHLSSDTLRRLKTSKVDYQYSLYVQGTTKLENEIASKEVLERTQIFQIGVLLVEIALERTLSSSDSMKLEFESKSISVVEKSMGTRYRQACEFCLNNKEGDTYLPAAETLASHNDTEVIVNSEYMIKQYYSEVFMR